MCYSYSNLLIAILLPWICMETAPAQPIWGLIDSNVWGLCISIVIPLPPALLPVGTENWQRETKLYVARLFHPMQYCCKCFFCLNGITKSMDIHIVHQPKKKQKLPRSMHSEWGSWWWWRSNPLLNKQSASLQQHKHTTPSSPVTPKWLSSFLMAL